MKKANTLFYIITIGGLLLLITGVLRAGHQLEPPAVAMPPAAQSSFVASLQTALQHPLAIFLLQLVLIILASRLFGYLFRKMGQPGVMGEIIAGIILGPSLMGWLTPGFSAFIFPVTSLGNLQMLSQVGLVLFMFVVGMELDLNIVKKKAGSAVVISHASIVIPYGLGVALSYFMYRSYAPKDIPFYAFALFMGIAMSVTAFPVLARVIRERGMSRTRLGAIAITCAAADDVTAWCILAIIIAIVKAGSIGSSLYTLLLAAGYVLLMLFAVKPLLKKLASRSRHNGVLKQSTLAIVMVVMLLSAWCCELIGIHALFGAFMAGVIMPLEWDFRKVLMEKIEDIALVLLLPLFFVFTGLRTHIGLLNEPGLWGMCLLIIAVAVAGKFGGSALAAKITGESTRDSLAIGALMNTRGLMELVVLNIGYDLGILTPEVFAMLVIMAVVTTLMTSPLLNLIERMKDRS